MVHSMVLRTSAAVVLAAGLMLVATATSATANNGDPVKAGQVTTATNVTVVDNSFGASCSAFDSRDGLLGCGHSGVTGLGSDVGVAGNGRFFGVTGSSSDNDGVYGTGGTNGVFGLTSNPFASGVYGQNNATGFGVAGRATNGTGVLADSANGTALQVTGRTKFSTAGIAVVASGKQKVTVTLAGVTTSDFVLATVQGAGAFSVTNAAAGTGKFTININKAPAAPATVAVAYFVISAS